MNGMTIGVKVQVEQIGLTCGIQQYVPSLWFYVLCRMHSYEKKLYCSAEKL